MPLGLPLLPLGIGPSLLLLLPIPRPRFSPHLSALGGNVRHVRGRNHQRALVGRVGIAQDRGQGNVATDAGRHGFLDVSPDDVHQRPLPLVVVTVAVDCLALPSKQFLHPEAESRQRRDAPPEAEIVPSAVRGPAGRIVRHLLGPAVMRTHVGQSQFVRHGLHGRQFLPHRIDQHERYGRIGDRQGKSGESTPGTDVDGHSTIIPLFRIVIVIVVVVVVVGKRPAQRKVGNGTQSRAGEDVSSEYHIDVAIPPAD
mmetsp:Transcript_42852/g.130317  ORF Transcript_42852/g.130317 Transcript_42852/m.130317 type:complete len:255 (+) Transcript_42852:182-946(+)